MKKTMFRLMAKIIGIVALCAAAIFVYDYYKEIGLFFAEVWSWATNQWFYILLTTAVSTLLGWFSHKTNGNIPTCYHIGLSRPKAYQLEKIILLAGKILLWVGLAGVALSLFPLFNHLGWIKIFLIILGGLVVFAIFLFIEIVIEDSTGSESDKTFWTRFVLVIGLLSLGYYLDIFIFAFKPWIALSIGSLILAYIGIFNLISYSKKRKAANKIKRAEEIERKNEKELRESLADLPLKFLAMQYIHLKDMLNQDQRNEKTKKIALIHFEVLQELLKSGKKSWKDDLEEICKKISQTRYSLDKDFLILITQECLKADAVDLIFTTSGYYNSRLPILFANHPGKKEIMNKFFQGELKEEPVNKLIKNFLYNSVKREFRTNVFAGIIEIFTFAYHKNWDEDTLKLLINEIQSFFDFAAECLPKIREEEGADTLGRCLLTTIKQLRLIGIAASEQEKSREEEIIKYLEKINN